MNYTQDGRIISIDTPLGPDVLLLQGFAGHEGISQLFSFDLDLLSEEPALPFDGILGKQITLRVALGHGEERHFNGFVSRFTQSGQDSRFTYYRAEMIPWLWFLSRTTDCRIFQGMTVPDIIERVFNDWGFTDFKNLLRRSYKPREYCVQYRETALNFVSRLMEQYGIFYFFEHTASKHTLVLADTPTAHEPCPQQSEARCVFREQLAHGERVVTNCYADQEVRSGKYALTDYNFETPSTSLATAVGTTVAVGGNSALEIYDYPGEYQERSEGDELVKLRMEEEEAAHFVLRGNSTCAAFTSGYRVALTDHYRTDLNRPYVLVEIQHRATVGGNYGMAALAGEEEGYSNHFGAIPHAVPYRPPRVTSRPAVPGVQTAVVVGKAGEEIWTDKYGRVKVQFHWDRTGKHDENSSCWVRVSHPWAGKNWGGISLPRIGQEVIVDFLEGDPDRPIITGRVYNAEQMPPYGLPANQTQSGMKSRSSKGGAAANFNEIRMEDKKGSEELYIHAEKDENIVVENDQTLNVGRNKSELVGKDKSIRVEGSHGEGIGGSMTVTVGMNLTESVAINYAETVGAAMELTVGGVLAESVGVNKAQTIGRSKSEDIGVDKTVDIGKNLKEKVGEDQTVEIGKDLTEKIKGQHQETVEKEFLLQAKKIQLVAKDEVTIKTGGAEVVMKKNGDITIKGKKINVKGSGDVVIKGSNIKEN